MDIYKLDQHELADKIIEFAKVFKTKADNVTLENLEESLKGLFRFSTEKIEALREEIEEVERTLEDIELDLRSTSRRLTDLKSELKDIR